MLRGVMCLRHTAHAASLITFTMRMCITQHLLCQFFRTSRPHPFDTSLMHVRTDALLHASRRVEFELATLLPKLLPCWCRLHAAPSCQKQHQVYKTRRSSWSKVNVGLCGCAVRPNAWNLFCWSYQGSTTLCSPPSAHHCCDATANGMQLRTLCLCLTRVFAVLGHVGASSLTSGTPELDCQQVSPVAENSAA